MSSEYDEFDETEDDGDSLSHIGIARRSGRYPWGSGGDPYQRSKGFKSYLEEMRSQGLTDTQIAAGLSTKEHPVTTTDLRAAISNSTQHIFAANQAMAYRLKEKGMSTSAIARRMSTPEKVLNESVVRGWLAKPNEVKEGSIQGVADVLKSNVQEKKFLDVGKGNELHMGIAETRLRLAVSSLKDEGYEVHLVKLPQLGTDKMTEHKVLALPGTPWREAKDAVVQGKVGYVFQHSDDGGLTFNRPTKEPVSLDPKRIEINYKETGGATKDGVIELRRGVEDLSLDGKNYAQVRVAVDGTHYLKGMAMYADDLPAGVDVRFNTNKGKDTPMLGPKDNSVLKPLKDDPANRFGATTYPKTFIDKSGKEKTSPLNIVHEEGNWDEWSKSLSSQMLSKQPLSLAQTQLGKTRAKKEEQFNEIMGLTNPVVKKKLLDEFAESADSASVHLKAAAIDNQSSHVILPINSIKPHEIYAPNFNNGDKVSLVRYPHGGPFEIPELTVNNNNREAKRILQGARDAVGIHHTVAEQLSGADFDGDTVIVIPNNTGKVKSRPPLEGLKNFDAKAQYGIPLGDTTTKRMTKAGTQAEMGKISNLITDMTLHKANDSELAAAVRHSMVVIDAEKHGLNYKQSEIDNGIAALKKKYQYEPSGGTSKGASTLISRASSEVKVDKQKLRAAKDGGPVDPVTGKLVWEKTGESYMKPVKDRAGNPTGEFVEVKKQSTVTRAGNTDDARTLLSGGVERGGTPMEELYASHSNSMKAMANQARVESIKARAAYPKLSPAAKAVYSEQVKSLDAKLKNAERNAPLERRAQVIGSALAKARIDAHPELEKDDIKKIKYQELDNARNAVNAKKESIEITPREWEAIQSGAVASTKLSAILTHADMEKVKQLASPRARTSLTPGQLARVRSMQSSGRSMTEISEALGLPRSTIVDNLKDK